MSDLPESKLLPLFLLMSSMVTEEAMNSGQDLTSSEKSYYFL